MIAIISIFAGSVLLVLWSALALGSRADDDAGRP